MSRLVKLGAFSLLGFAITGVAVVSAAEDELQPLEQVFDKRVLDQWDWETRKSFWFTSQGSQVVPYTWFVALEEAQSTDRFARNEHIEALRYIPLPASQENPDGLPLGFVRDQDYVGFTCAACHTGQVDYTDENGKKHSWIVDGAPTLGYFDRFLEELVAALTATADTANHGDKFDRFAGRVLSAGYGTREKQQLHDQLQKEIERLDARVQSNKHPHSNYSGFGRIDAYGEVFNQVAGLDLDVAKNIETPDAPASIPYLWNAHYADRVQWNGGGNNTDAKLGLLMGPLLRNVVEVLGVFGRLQFEGGSVVGFPSTIDWKGLGELESKLCRLDPPKWPAELPKPDPELVAKGKALFAIDGKGRCASCHALTPPRTAHTVGRIPTDRIGTDPNLADNARDRKAKTGKLEGTPKNIISGDEFGAEAPAYEIVRTAVVGVILKSPVEATRAMRTGDCGARRDGSDSSANVIEIVANELAKSIVEFEMPREYIARPLNGIWATAPYLHNGSVPSLAELLKRPAERVTSFHVGNREFDPEHVGFATTEGSSSTALDTSLGGNTNKGHDMAETFTDTERKQLLEYLKTL